MKKKLRDRVRLEHIKEAAEKIFQFMELAETFEQFSANEMLQSACIRQLEIIGEATAHLSKELREMHYSEAWEKATFMRNFLIHEYFRVDPIPVWDAIQSHLPVFIEEVKTILKNLPTDSE